MNITMKGDVDMKCLNVNTCGCVCSLRAPGGLQDRFQHVGHGREPNGGQDGVPGGERFTFDYATSRPSPSVHHLVPVRVQHVESDLPAVGPEGGEPFRQPAGSSKAHFL